ncbi:hypothetical protein D3C81_1856120 [compost metagenome]
MGRDGLAGRNTNCTGKLRANLSGFAQRAVQLIQDTLKACCQLLSGVGKHHLSRGPVQQAHARLPFQLFYAVAHRRLA